MTVFDFFEVGGCVRDDLMGIHTKDVDFTVVSSNTNLSVASLFGQLETFLQSEEFEIFESRFQFLTIRAKVPNGHPLKNRTDVADFVLARKDGPSTDGRRPDWVKPGTLLDDLARRDFTMNAIARDINGELIDPFDGQSAIQEGMISFVGNPSLRISEDGIRTLRALRFQITKGFEIDAPAWEAVNSDLAAEMLHCVSINRVREELNKMFRHDSSAAFRLLADIDERVFKAIFRDGLRLDATLAS